MYIFSCEIKFDPSYKTVCVYVSECICTYILWRSCIKINYDVRIGYNHIADKIEGNTITLHQNSNPVPFDWNCFVYLTSLHNTLHCISTESEYVTPISRWNDN